MILGILYTASSARERAERFYELIQLDLEPQIFTGDEEFKDLFPLIGQISYNVMIKHYNQSVGAAKKIPLEVFDFKQDNIATKKFIASEIKSKLLASIFGTSPFQEKAQFVSKMANRLQGYLRPEQLRETIFENLD